MSQAPAVLFFCDPSSIHNQKWLNGLRTERPIVVVCKQGDADPSEYPFPVFPILPQTFPFKRVDLLWTTLRAIRRIIEQHQVGLMHAIYLWHYGLWPSFVASTPYVITTWGTDVFGSLTNAFNAKGISGIWERWLAKRALDRAQWITCTSQSQGDRIVELLHKPYPFTWIPTGIDTDFFQAKTGHEAGGLRLFSPRSMKPLYRVIEIVKAAAALHEERKDVTLILIDDGVDIAYSSEVRAVTQSFASTGLKIEWCGKSSAEQMKDYYGQADVVVMWPVTDGLPNSALEAMSMQRVVVLPPLDYDTNIFQEHLIFRASGHDVQDLVEVLRRASEALKGNLEPTLAEARANVVKHASLRHALHILKEGYTRLEGGM
jgi:glycosyltransferase involved in cell wall biosynthesis